MPFMGIGYKNADKLLWKNVSFSWACEPAQSPELNSIEIIKTLWIKLGMSLMRESSKVRIL